MNIKELVVRKIESELESLQIIYDCKFNNQDTINNIIETCLAVCKIYNISGESFICIGERQTFRDAHYECFKIKCMFAYCNIDFSLIGQKK